MKKTQISAVIKLKKKNIKKKNEKKNIKKNINISVCMSAFLLFMFMGHVA